MVLHTVVVKDLSGKQLKLRVRLTDHVLDVKCVLEMRWRIPLHGQRLVFKRVLEDSMTLLSVIKVDDEPTVFHLMPRMLCDVWIRPSVTNWPAWGPSTHHLFTSRARTHAIELLNIGYLLADRVDAPRAFSDVWMARVIPLLVLFGGDGEQVSGSMVKRVRHETLQMDSMALFQPAQEGIVYQDLHCMVIRTHTVDYTDIWINVAFPPDYPFKPPTLELLNQACVLHPCVMPGGGAIQLLLSPSNWSPGVTISTLVQSLCETFTIDIAVRLARGSRLFASCDCALEHARRSFAQWTDEDFARRAVRSVPCTPEVPQRVVKAGPRSIAAFIEKKLASPSVAVADDNVKRLHIVDQLSLSVSDNQKIFKFCWDVF